MPSLKALASVLALFCAPALAFGQSVPGQDDGPPARSYLHAGWSTPEGPRIAALRMELEPGWKTYWRSPGDSGIPPDFDWSGSENLADVRIAWPTPIVFDTYGARTLGYQDRMTLPVELTPKDPTLPMRVRLSLFYGVCSDICVPAREDLAIDIAPADAPEGEYFIRQAFEALPASAAAAGLTAAACEMTLDANGDGELSARLSFSHPLSGAPLIVAEGPEGVWFGPVDARVEGGDLVAEAPMRAEPGAWIDRASLRFTLLGGPRALQHDGCAPIG